MSTKSSSSPTVARRAVPDRAACGWRVRRMKLKNMYGRQVRGVERSTFVMDREGRIVKEGRGVKVPGHAQDVLGLSSLRPALGVSLCDTGGGPEKALVSGNHRHSLRFSSFLFTMGCAYATCTIQLARSLPAAGFLFFNPSKSLIDAQRSPERLLRKARSPGGNARLRPARGGADATRTSTSSHPRRAADDHEAVR